MTDSIRKTRRQTRNSISGAVVKSTSDQNNETKAKLPEQPQVDVTFEQDISLLLSAANVGGTYPFDKQISQIYSSFKVSFPSLKVTVNQVHRRLISLVTYKKQHLAFKNTLRPFRKYMDGENPTWRNLLPFFQARMHLLKCLHINSVRCRKFIINEINSAKIKDDLKSINDYLNGVHFKGDSNFESSENNSVLDQIDYGNEDEDAEEERDYLYIPPSKESTINHRKFYATQRLLQFPIPTKLPSKSINQLLQKQEQQQTKESNADQNQLNLPDDDDNDDNENGKDALPSVGSEKEEKGKGKEEDVKEKSSGKSGRGRGRPRKYFRTEEHQQSQKENTNQTTVKKRKKKSPANRTPSLKKRRSSRKFTNAQSNSIAPIAVDIRENNNISNLEHPNTNSLPLPSSSPRMQVDDPNTDSASQRVQSTNSDRKCTTTEKSYGAIQSESCAILKENSIVNSSLKNTPSLVAALLYDGNTNTNANLINKGNQEQNVIGGQRNSKVHNDTGNGTVTEQKEKSNCGSKFDIAGLLNGDSVPNECEDNDKENHVETRIGTQESKEDENETGNMLTPKSRNKQTKGDNDRVQEETREFDVNQLIDSIVANPNNQADSSKSISKEHQQQHSENDSENSHAVVNALFVSEHELGLDELNDDSHLDAIENRTSEDDNADGDDKLKALIRDFDMNTATQSTPKARIAEQEQQTQWQ